MKYLGPDSYQDAGEAIEALELELGLPAGFYRDLKNEDDWSFVIKFHSLVEAAVSELLTIRLGKEELADFFAFLELSNNKTGKIAVVSALGVLPKEIRAFIRKLSEIRNMCVHDIGNVTQSISVVSNSAQNKDKAKALAKAFSVGVEQIDFDERKLENFQYFQEDAKHFIWTAGIVVLAIIFARTQQSYEIAELQEKLARMKGALNLLEGNWDSISLSG